MDWQLSLVPNMGTQEGTADKLKLPYFTALFGVEPGPWVCQTSIHSPLSFIFWPPNVHSSQVIRLFCCYWVKGLSLFSILEISRKDGSREGRLMQEKWFNDTYLMGLLWGMDVLTNVEGLEQGLSHGRATCSCRYRGQWACSQISWVYILDLPLPCCAPLCKSLKDLVLQYLFIFGVLRWGLTM